MNLLSLVRRTCNRLLSTSLANADLDAQIRIEIRWRDAIGATRAGCASANLYEVQLERSGSMHLHDSVSLRSRVVRHARLDGVYLPDTAMPFAAERSARSPMPSRKVRAARSRPLS